MKKERFKRRIRKITAFAAAVAMAAAFTFPAEVGYGIFVGFGNAIVASAENIGEFTVTGGALNTDYTYIDNVLTVKTATPITISGTTTIARIEVESGVSANITLAGVNIDVSSSGIAAFKIADNSTGNVTITLADGSENTLKSGENCAGLQKCGSGDGIGKLTIKGGTGKLTAAGGYRGAGIGGNLSGGSKIEISGGTVTANGGAEGAGIGGGKGGSGSYITISGGTVTANGGEYGAGIGGGDSGSGSNITISGGTVTAKGGFRGAGIGGGKGGSGSDITISGGTVTATGGIGGGDSGSGSNIIISGGIVTANGGEYGAGIGGGGSGGSGSDITISGGTVTVTGGTGGAGIGGGESGSGSNIIISGGSVKAVAGTDANAIGGGYNGNGAVTPTSNGTTPVYLLTIANPDSAAVLIDGKAYTPVNHKAADSEDGNLYAYRSGETCEVKVGDKTFIYEFYSESSTFALAPLTIYATNGGTLTHGTDYTYTDGVLTVKTEKAVTIANIDPTAATTERIEVESGVSANITLAGVNIDVSSLSDTAAFKIADNSTGNVTITLADGSGNTLKSGTNCAGFQKNGGTNTGKLTIKGGTNGTGNLTATCGTNGAGIGGGKGGSGSNITISGGTVTATCDYQGAGIGGGNGGSGSVITISGGTVTAKGGSWGAGIGGANGSGSNIEISGGTVTANGGSSGAGIGGGTSSSGSNIKITGGTVTAKGGYYSAGIGGGDSGSGSNITISGGTVTAEGGAGKIIGTDSAGGAGIGGGASGSGSNIIISGGSVKAVKGTDANAIGGGNGKEAVIPTNGTDNVYLLTIANPDGEAVLIGGNSYTPVNHKAVAGNDGNLYAYLPAKTSIDDPLVVKVGEKTTKYIYDTKWLIVPTVTAPTAKDDLVYTGEAQALVTSGTTSGGTMVYSFDENGEYTADIPTGTNATTYTVWYKSVDGEVYADTFPASVSVTIEKADPAGDKDRDINVVRGVGTFTEPVFTGVDGQPLDGYIMYDDHMRYTYLGIADYLRQSSAEREDIEYEFDPNDSNYNNVIGQIHFYICDVAFKVGDADATAANAVTVKDNPTYGDTWAEILTLNTGLKAVLLDETVKIGFSFDVTGSPNAGDAQEYKVLFNGTIGGKTFTNHVVATGTVDVGKKEIDEIVITDITAPAAKETLDTSASTSVTNYTLGAVSWTDGDTTAKFNKEYTATVVVTADSNHTFGSSLTAKVNGETASVTNNANGTVTVTYTFAKTAAAAVTKIEMKTSPTRTEYFVGESINLTGATIIATYEDSTTSEPIPITAEMISGFDSDTAGTKTVTVTYEGKTTTFDVTIKEPAVTGITISTTPKTEYLIGDSLDVTGGKITVSYEYGADKVIAITSGMVTGFDSSAAVSSQTLTVTYQEKTDTYTITVKKHTPSITAPTASAITLGQTLANSTLSDNTWSWSDSSIQPTSAGTHSYTAVKNVNDTDYYDYTALSGFTFNSTTNTLTTNVSVEVRRAGASVTPPTASNTLTYGQALSAAGLTEGWTWENASTVPDVNNTGFTAYKIVTDYDNFDYSNLTGFAYDETAHKLSCTVAVTVNPTAPTDATTVSQSFTNGTASTAFAAPVFKGIDGAELTGSVSYTYGGQTYTTTAALTAVLDTLDGETTGTISYTFTPNSANYTTASGSISFSVIDAVVTGITLKSAPTKTTYEVGDTLDLTGGKITVSYNNGTSVDIDITDAMTSGFDSTTAGEKTVTVTYGGFSVTFKVTVNKGSFTVEPTPGNMEGAEIDMPVDELNDAVLTPEDKELIEQGVDIAVLMTVITINPETVPANDVTAIDNVMGDFELGCYIDVELFKRYSNGNPDVPVTDTNAPITISFKVPADILAQYPVSEYEYSVFCSHNGVGYPITCSYNAATNVMSFSSTMFSTYALAVKATTPAAVDYTITADSHVTVQTTAQAGETVIVTVEGGYKATVTNSLGAVIATITGTGSFVMPESNVTITSELINTHVHNYSTEWNMDSTSHWHECACGDKVNVAAHVSNGGIVTVRPTETTEGVRTYSCSICGYVMSTETIPMLAPDHSHSYGTQWKSDSTSHWHECACGEKVDIAYHISDNGVVTLQPTETSEGIMTYSCSICGYILRTETIPANTPVHTHNYGTAWYYDSTSHWHECSCGDKSNIGQHIPDGGRVTVQPTAYTTGVRTYSCSICGYVLGTETIPATGYNYPGYPTYPTYPFDSSIFNVVSFTDKLNVTTETKGNTVTLKWDKVEKADKYYVYQYKNGKYVKVKTTSDTSATFKKLKNGETYKFLIRYTKSGRLSPTKYSGTVSVKVYYKPIPKPTATKNSIKLTWEAIPEAEKYAVYKYVDGMAIKLTETKKLSVKIGKLIPNTEYKYIVRAYVGGKWTTMLKSDIVTVKTKAK